MAASTISVIEARLPYTDRRVLSQAWFSALHLARGAGGPEPSRRARRSPMPIAPARPSAARRTLRAPAPAGAERRIAARERRSGAVGAPDRSRRIGDAALRARAGAALERARSYPPFRTSITIDARGGGRVHVIVRRVGPTLHVVALCPPALEGSVRRAFARASEHFAARGDRMRVDLRTGAA